MTWKGIVLGAATVGAAALAGRVIVMEFFPGALNLLASAVP